MKETILSSIIGQLLTKAQTYNKEEKNNLTRFYYITY